MVIGAPIYAEVGASGRASSRRDRLVTAELSTELQRLFDLAEARARKLPTHLTAPPGAMSERPDSRSVRSSP